jgi:hypothetical protein
MGPSGFFPEFVIPRLASENEGARVEPAGGMGMTGLDRATKYSTYLFALPTLAESLSRPFDLAGVTSELNLLGEPGEAGEINDLLAIAADWAAIGEDFKAAFAGEVNRSSEKELAASVLLAIILGLAEGKGDE